MPFHIPYELLTIIVQDCDPSVLFALTQVSMILRRVVYENLPPKDEIPPDLAIHLLCNQKPKHQEHSRVDIDQLPPIELGYESDDSDIRGAGDIRRNKNSSKITAQTSIPPNFQKAMKTDDQQRNTTKPDNLNQSSGKRLYAPPFNLIDISYAYFHSEKSTRFIISVGEWMVGDRKTAPDDVHALRCFLAYKAYRAEEDKRIKAVLEAARRKEIEEIERSEVTLYDFGNRGFTTDFVERGQDEEEEEEGRGEFDRGEGGAGESSILWEQDDAL